MTRSGRVNSLRRIHPTTFLSPNPSGPTFASLDWIAGTFFTHAWRPSRAVRRHSHRCLRATSSAATSTRCSRPTVSRVRPTAHCSPGFSTFRSRICDAASARPTPRSLQQGITFTVYGDKGGTERVFPYDLLPRILTHDEWDHISRGLSQRLLALNLFLQDVYTDGRILAEGVVPRELVVTAQHYRREMRGLYHRADVRISVAGTDLVRLPDGSFAVLEDNLRVPSGVLVHADEPPDHQARLPEALHRLRDRADRPLRPVAPWRAPGTRAGPAVEPDDRRADAWRLQLGVFRACVSCAADGRRARRRPGPPCPRQHRLHAHDARPAARGRDLPARG